MRRINIISIVIVFLVSILFMDRSVQASPTIDKVSISGDPTIGSTLTGSYDFIVNSVPEGKSSFRWLRVPDLTSQWGAPYLLCKTANINWVTNSPSGPPMPLEFTVTATTLIQQISNYHYSTSFDPSTTISLEGPEGVYGPWNVESLISDNGYYRGVKPNIEIPAGTYTVIDSNSETWSYNNQSGNRGMSEIIGYTIIPGAEETSYKLQNDDYGMKVMFEVTPRNTSDEVGPVKVSSPFGPIGGTLLPENKGPVAVDDSAITDEEEAVTIAVLDNDSDPDEDELTVTSVQHISGGEGTFAVVDNEIVFTPNGGVIGEVVLRYYIEDTAGHDASAMITIEVNPVNTGGHFEIKLVEMVGNEGVVAWDAYPDATSYVVWVTGKEFARVLKSQSDDVYQITIPNLSLEQMNYVQVVEYNGDDGLGSQNMKILPYTIQSDQEALSVDYLGEAYQVEPSSQKTILVQEYHNPLIRLEEGYYNDFKLTWEIDGLLKEEEVASQVAQCAPVLTCLDNGKIGYPMTLIASSNTSNDEAIVVAILSDSMDDPAKDHAEQYILEAYIKKYDDLSQISTTESFDIWLADYCEAEENGTLLVPFIPVKGKKVRVYEVIEIAKAEDRPINVESKASTISSVLYDKVGTSYLNHTIDQVNGLITFELASSIEDYGRVLDLSEAFEGNKKATKLILLDFYEDDALPLVEEPVSETTETKVSSTKATTYYELTISSTEGGSVLGFEGTRSISSGSRVILRNVVDEGYEFVGYEGDIDTLNDDELIMNSDKSIKAVFALIEEDIEEDIFDETTPEDGSFPVEEEILDQVSTDEVVPEADPLPQTGGLTMLFFVVFGGIFAGVGIGSKMKR